MRSSFHSKSILELLIKVVLIEGGVSRTFGESVPRRSTTPGTVRHVRLNRELWFCSGVFGHWLSVKFGMGRFIPRANPIHRLDLANLAVFFRPFAVVCRLSFPRLVKYRA